MIDAPSYVIAAPAHDIEDAAAAYNPVIIAESTTALRAHHGRINLVFAARTAMWAGSIRPPRRPKAADRGH